MNWLRVGAVFMAIGVAAGAFGAHGLSGRVPEDLIEVWKTGARYHLVHGLGLCVLGLLPSPPNLTGWLFSAGILLFAGSLYAMTLTGHRWLGAITPLGGVAFIAGWIVLAVKSGSAA